MADRALVIPDSARVGTKAWADTVVAVARRDASFTEKDVRPLVDRYRALCEHAVWETWLADEPRTLERFCREALGYEADFLETMSAGVAVLEKEGFSGPVSVRAARDAVAAQVRERAARRSFIAAADAAPIAPRGRPPKNSNTAFSSRDQGESYLRRRLKRDRPDLYEEVARGSKSAHKAAVEASIRKPTTTIRTDDPMKAAEVLLAHYKGEQLALLIKHLQKECDK